MFSLGLITLLKNYNFGRNSTLRTRVCERPLVRRQQCTIILRAQGRGLIDVLNSLTFDYNVLIQMPFTRHIP